MMDVALHSGLAAHPAAREVMRARLAWRPHRRWRAVVPRAWRNWWTIALLACMATIAAAQDDIEGREDAARAVGAPLASQRLAGLLWFVENGTAADDKAVLPLLTDEEPRVRELAEQGVWALWSRSGDAGIDALMARGMREAGARRFAAAIATYSEVIRLDPAFAEGWNKRATVHFLAGDYAKSLADCDEVLKRNPFHFGALSGYGQIHFQRKQYERAIQYWRRALDVNPNLSLARNIEVARKLHAATRKNAT